MQLLTQISLLPRKLPLLGSMYKILSENEMLLTQIFILVTLAINILLVLYYEVEGDSI